MTVQPRRTIRVVTPPACEPLELSGVKDWAKIDHDEEDPLLIDLIFAARETAENYTRRALLTQTIRLTLDVGCSDAADMLGEGVYDLPVSAIHGLLPRYIDLPRAPVQSITNVTTYDLNDAATPFSPSNYRLSADGSRLVLGYNATWPSNLRREAAVEVLYQAGYGDSATSVPRAIRTGMLMHIQLMYDGRTACDLPDACVDLYRPYRIMDVR